MIGVGIPSVYFGLNPTEGSKSPLQEHYDNGTILIHHNAQGSIPEGGPATAFTNLGGAGSTFDATVSEGVVPLDGNWMLADPANGYPELGYPAELIGVRLMWVASLDNATGTYRFFGHAPSNSYIRINNGTQLQFNYTGVPSFSGITATTNPRLFEVEITPSEISLYIDGSFLETLSHTATTIPVSRILQGPTSFQPFKGRMGDIMGIVGTGPDKDNAVSDARDYLNDRFSLGLSL